MGTTVSLSWGCFKSWLVVASLFSGDWASPSSPSRLDVLTKLGCWYSLIASKSGFKKTDSLKEIGSWSQVHRALWSRYTMCLHILRLRAKSVQVQFGTSSEELTLTSCTESWPPLKENEPPPFDSTSDASMFSEAWNGCLRHSWNNVGRPCRKAGRSMRGFLHIPDIFTFSSRYLQSYTVWVSSNVNEGR